MEEKFVQNPDNRYRIIYYSPSMNELKTLYRETFKNYIGGYLTHFDTEMRNLGYDDINNLVQSTFDFAKVIFKISEVGEAKYYVGLQDIYSGDIINRFYLNVYSYHPEQGYVILRKEHDRDCWAGSNDEFVLNVVSLKTGLEFRCDFVGRPSGLVNRSLCGWSLTHQRFAVFQIDESDGSLIEVPESEPYENVWQNFPPENHSRVTELDIEFIEAPNPYFESVEFILAAAEKISQEDFNAGHDPISDAVTNLENKCLECSNAPDVLDHEDFLILQQEKKNMYMDGASTFQDYIEEMEFIRLLAELEPQEDPTEDSGDSDENKIIA